MNAIVVGVVADARAVGNRDIFVENGASNVAIPADRAMIQNDRVFDGALAPNDRIATEHGAAEKEDC